MQPMFRGGYEIFYVASSITIGNGCKASFWEATWLHGRKSKEIAPLIFAISRRNSWKVNHALKDNTWVAKIKMGDNFTMQHLVQFVELWVQLQDVHLNEEIHDEITWKLSASGKYSE
jgi:hypothetical protein